MQRVDVGTMMGGAGGNVSDVFEATHYFLRKRDERYVCIFGSLLYTTVLIGCCDLQLIVGERSLDDMCCL